MFVHNFERIFLEVLWKFPVSNNISLALIADESFSNYQAAPPAQKQTSASVGSFS